MVSTKTENEAKRRAITPRTMAVVAWLTADEQGEEMSHCQYLTPKQKNQTYARLRGAPYPEM